MWERAVTGHGGAWAPGAEMLAVPALAVSGLHWWVGMARTPLLFMTLPF